jgi:hypothetical protein
MNTPCPRCGYTEGVSVKPMNNAMYNYVDEKTGEVDGTYNTNDKFITVKGVKLVRQDLWVKPVEVVKPVVVPVVKK